MARPVTMFTGQWADLSLEELAAKCNDFGYDGLELACWGDHFEIDKALAEDDYCAKKRELLEKNDLQVFAISSHLVGQAVLDNIDARHQAILSPEIWGDGNPAGVNARAAENMIASARADKGYMESLLKKYPKNTNKLDVYLRQYYLEVLDEVLSGVQHKYIIRTGEEDQGKLWLMFGKDPQDMEPKKEEKR